MLCFAATICVVEGLIPENRTATLPIYRSVDVICTAAVVLMFLLQSDFLRVIQIW